jgi:hypothetical protein
MDRGLIVFASGDHSDEIGRAQVPEPHSWVPWIQACAILVLLLRFLRITLLLSSRIHGRWWLVELEQELDVSPRIVTAGCGYACN